MLHILKCSRKAAEVHTCTRLLHIVHTYWLGFTPEREIKEKKKKEKKEKKEKKGLFVERERERKEKKERKRKEKKRKGRKGAVRCASPLFSVVCCDFLCVQARASSTV